MYRFLYVLTDFLISFAKFNYADKKTSINNIIYFVITKNF